MHDAIAPQPPLSLAFDASKLFERNWGVPQFRKRLRVHISIYHEFRQITALLSGGRMNKKVAYVSW